MLKFPKPKSRKSEKRREKAHRNAVIAAVRSDVVRRDPRCRCCGDFLFNHGEMHELRSRAQLRGKLPEEIFNTANCVMLCHACHVEVTDHRIDLVPVDQDAGANGKLDVQRTLPCD
jgi:5-methylcytosine-specific restriction endonuclease McrA